jgi:hypothetical protein
MRYHSSGQFNNVGPLEQGPVPDHGIVQQTLRKPVLRYVTLFHESDKMSFAKDASGQNGQNAEDVQAEMV